MSRRRSCRARSGACVWSTTGRWFVSLLCEETITPLAPVGQSVGVDAGITSLVTLSTGEKITNPRHERRDYPSSKLCSACGHRAAAMPLGVREWTCIRCGCVHDRDVNAARNLLAAGLAES